MNGWMDEFDFFDCIPNMPDIIQYVQRTIAKTWKSCIPDMLLLYFAAFRWVKFEEKVEEGGERWSKPHVSTLSLHSLFELRTCLQTGTVLLDLEGYSLPQIVGEMSKPLLEHHIFMKEIL